MIHIINIIAAIILGKLLLFNKYIMAFIAILYLAIIKVSTSISLLDFTVTILTLSAIVTITASLPKKKQQTKEAQAVILKNKFRIELLLTNGKTFIDDMRTGIGISGGSGSGKTESVCNSILVHCEKNSFAGFIGDFKNFELTRFAYAKYKNNVNVKFNVFSIHEPEYSARLNVLDSKYLKGEAEVNSIAKGLMINFIGGEPKDDSSKYFFNGAVSLLTAIIWRFKTSFKDKCNLPYLISFICMGEHDEIIETHKGTEIIPLEKLKRFIQEDDRASMLGSMFIKITNPKEQSSLFGSVTSYLRTLADPRVFYLLTANDFYLDINSKNNKRFIALVNTPGTLQDVITPINGMIAEAIFQKVSETTEENREDMVVILDEAPRFKVQKLGARVSTLRALRCYFTYILQDKIQAKTEYEGRDYFVKEILANLSNQFIGKVNDPESGKYYEGFFEEIKEKQISTTSGSMFSAGDARTTTSNKDKRKVKDFEFRALRPGEFYKVSSSGTAKIRFKYDKRNLQSEMPPKVRNITESELEENYLFIINEAKTYFYQ